MNRSLLRSCRRLRPSLRSAAGLTLALVLGTPAVTTAHSPDPQLSGSIWNANQVVGWTWASSQVPPGWLQSAFFDAANASNVSRRARAAIFSFQGGAGSVIAYGEPTGCSAAGIACFRSNPPWSFRIWYRADGYWFDWGRLRWCQASGYSYGCFDATTVGLDELGHVEGLNHHLNYSDSSDYADAVVQAVSRSNPRTGWNAHLFGRCDVARLQIIYDRLTTSDPFSTCLSLESVTSLGASATTVQKWGSVVFSATLRTLVSSGYGALSGDPISGRAVYLERRFPGASTWTTITAMSPAGEGVYAATVTITGTYEWRAAFYPSGEGIAGSASAPVTVQMLNCRSCPVALSAAER